MAHHKQITVQFISSGDQIADIFTKSLSFVRFAALRNKLNVFAPAQLEGACSDTDKFVPVLPQQSNLLSGNCGTSRQQTLSG